MLDLCKKEEQKEEEDYAWTAELEYFNNKVEWYKFNLNLTEIMTTYNTPIFHTSFFELQLKLNDHRYFLVQHTDGSHTIYRCKRR